MEGISSLFDPDVPHEVIESIRSALSTGSTEVELTLRLPRDVAEKVLTVLTLERKGGALVVPAREEFTPAQAAAVLGISRQTVVRAIDEGRLPARKVGAHWRIRASDVAEFIEADLTDRRAAAMRVARATTTSTTTPSG